MAQVLDETLNEVEVLQNLSTTGRIGNMLFYVALSRQAASLPTTARLAEHISYLPELS